MNNDADQRPTPDPTTLTTQQMLRAVQAERDYVDGRFAVLEERLRAIDVATRLLDETVNRTPTDIQVAIKHVRELMDGEFRRVDQQFGSNQKALDAAFAAQEKQALATNASNKEAIGKSEANTKETIVNMGAQQAAGQKATDGKIDDLKERVGKIENLKQGGMDTVRAIYAFAAFLVALLIIGGAVAAVLAARPG